jgi:formylglycine-generating enzyme required for sulfatase activity
MFKVALLGAMAVAMHAATGCGAMFGSDYGIEMVPVAGGTFTMGCTGNDCSDREKPSHSVTLSSFKIGRCEVTQAQWLAVMGSWPGKEPSSEYGLGDSYPAYNVSWDDVQAFISKLNQLTGKRYRLPTEAEWEYAARGGQQTHGYTYSGSNTIGDVAWYEENSGETTHAVGTKQPNELGLYDMSGNVWEWCSDWYDDYNSSAQTNPTGASDGSDRVYRGGGWGNGTAFCAVSNRYRSGPSDRSVSLGFRLVLP